jgi:uncharacterized protein YjbI with pentapeptide repeats
MANPEHLAILKKGVKAWNEWREENPYIRPDLSDENLSLAIFSYANLSRVDLGGASLIKANLSRVDLSEANLSRANLHHVDF